MANCCSLTHTAIHTRMTLLNKNYQDLSHIQTWYKYKNQKINKTQCLEKVHIMTPTSHPFENVFFFSSADNRMNADHLPPASKKIIHSL